MRDKKCGVLWPCGSSITSPEGESFQKSHHIPPNPTKSVLRERTSLDSFDIAFSVVSALMVRVPLIWNTKRSYRNLNKEFCCKKIETIVHELCFPSLPSPSLQPILFSLKVSPRAGCVYMRIHFPFPSTCHLL